MGKNSKKNHDPNWRAEQQALAARARQGRVHNGPGVHDTGKLLRFSNVIMQRQADGSLRRMNGFGQKP